MSFCDIPPSHLARIFLRSEISADMLCGMPSRFYSLQLGIANIKVGCRLSREYADLKFLST